MGFNQFTISVRSRRGLVQARAEPVVSESACYPCRFSIECCWRLLRPDFPARKLHHVSTTSPDQVSGIGVLGRFIAIAHSTLVYLSKLSCRFPLGREWPLGNGGNVTVPNLRSHPATKPVFSTRTR